MQFALEGTLPPAHLVSVVVPAVGPGDDYHPVLAPFWVLGGKRADQPEAEAEQGDEDRLQHVSYSGGPERTTGDEYEYKYTSVSHLLLE
ncbi:hypothetical protein EYF80_025678 [Liparis tanakae]|uniref:Uncharacterized protein n=1 Tax=Liparis tanakae TaxID=230148 RepID=A0A4Z2HF52_9TELE|nr:hypothetical protein EYF80_025678 [Liparis tanakae]